MAYAKEDVHKSRKTSEQRITMESVIEKNRRFYYEYVEDLIHTHFQKYEDRIAVGIAGEGSDCFGYDDELSRDHDFGTGVCLWVTEEDMVRFGYNLSIAYNELVDSVERSYYTARLRERRGVMTIRNFYSNILQVDCDVENCVMTEQSWYRLDHSCLKTATNGEVFRDDLGAFTAFRNLLLRYYPDRVWRMRIADMLHTYAASIQVNYARCMTRGDVVAAGLCRSQGISSAMELYFLLCREYPPYYKWTFRALTELDKRGIFAGKIRELALTVTDLSAWEGTGYHPDRLNKRDRTVVLAEEIASELETMLQEKHLIREKRQYLETHVDELLSGC